MSQDAFSGNNDALRDLSKKVFGVDHILTVALVFRGAEKPMTIADLVGLTGIGGSSLRRSLDHLEAGGFIERLSAPGPDGARPYRRRESAFWLLVDELYRRASGQDAIFV